MIDAHRHTNGGNKPGHSETAMESDIAGSDQISLHQENNHPGQAENAVDDELRITVAGLMNPPEPVVRETPQRKGTGDRTDH